VSSNYRSHDLADKVIALSMAYERDNLLRRGLGFEHLRELALRLGRFILRQGGNLAYGGSWTVAENNLLTELLDLVRAEQEDNSIGGPDSRRPIGKLFNHAAWPDYLDVTPAIEARWIASCRIVRIDQRRAGLPASAVLADTKAKTPSPRLAFNRAVTLSAMRRLMMQDMELPITEAQPERIPAAVARILLGGKLATYSGFMPGIFEEALMTFENQKPLYLLGGFGGAAAVLADAILSKGALPPELSINWHRANNANFAALEKSARTLSRPRGIPKPESAYKSLCGFVVKARKNLAGTLRTGLGTEETRQLLQTRSVATAVRLVRVGLSKTRKLSVLPA
jgi:hypothetical protein